ncbi:MAG: cobalamin-dependent protein [Candidatus Hydrogenedens sp.]
MKKRLFLVNLGLRRPLYPLATPPMGLLYLSAYLRRALRDIDIGILNQRLENYSVEELCGRIKEFNPDIIGISTFTTFAYLLPSLIPMLRTACPSAWIIVG